VRRIVIATVLGVVLGGGALAQGQSDSVTVSAEKRREAISSFVTKLSTPSRLSGKLARWNVGVCPSVIGIRPEAVKFLEQRVRDTAERVGAPVSADTDCRPNIHIVFSTAPQALVSHIRNTQPYMLGYADSKANTDALATVKLPIQAWYANRMRDRTGKTIYETSKTAGSGNELMIPCGSPNDPRCPGGFMILPSAVGAMASTGGRLGDGLRSEFHNAIIVADPNALLDHEMGTLGDYIAMLALAQTETPTECASLPSILNLFSKGCAAPPTELTAADEGYLRGLYSMDAQAIIQTQRDQMIYKIGQSIEGR